MKLHIPLIGKTLTFARWVQDDEGDLGLRLFGFTLIKYKTHVIMHTPWTRDCFMPADKYQGRQDIIDAPHTQDADMLEQALAAASPCVGPYSRAELKIAGIILAGSFPNHGYTSHAIGNALAFAAPGKPRPTSTDLIFLAHFMRDRMRAAPTPSRKTPHYEYP